MSHRNAVVILCDQLRPDFLSVYGCRAAPTPNLERIANDGVVFDNAITQSTVCAPSRATMMTGRYVSDHGVWANDIPFREGLDYLPELMNEAGYATGAFGKLHHYPPDDLKGFGEAALMEEGRLGENEPYLQWLQERRPDVEAVWNQNGYEFAFDTEEYHEHWIASQAIDFLERRANDGPLFAWIAFQGPHSPYDPPSEVKGTVDTETLPKPLERPEGDLTPIVRYRKARGTEFRSQEEVMHTRTAYAEMIVEIDRQIGRILDSLESVGILQNTTIIFSSDHGDLLGDFGLDKKGPFPYRGQLDVPMIVANHPDITPGSRTESLVGTIDIPGTCLQIAQAEEEIGVSRSLIRQASAPLNQTRDVVFSEFCDSIKTVYDGRHLYSYYPFVGQGELYDRADDPDEQRNLAGTEEYADVERKLLMDLIDFGIIAKGFHVEAHDLVPEQQDGIRKKHPSFEREFEVAYPLNHRAVEKLDKEGLSTTYNEFCRDIGVTTTYDDPYWTEEEK